MPEMNYWEPNFSIDLKGPLTPWHWDLEWSEDKVISF